MRTKNKLYSRAQIRDELIGIGVDIRHRQNAHIASFGREHASPCDCCREYKGELAAISRAIGHFGGRFKFRGVA